MTEKEIKKVEDVMSRLVENEDFKEFIAEIERQQRRVEGKSIKATKWEQILKLQGEYESYKRILAYAK